MNQTKLIEVSSLSKEFDTIMSQELSRIASRNADATKGISGFLSNLSRITSFEKLESLYDFNGIAYVLLRSRILKEAAKRPLPPVLDIDFFTSQDILLALAADCGATPYLGQIGKKSMSKAYLHANWQVVAVMAWFQEHPEDQLERYTLRKGKQYEIARRFIIEKLYSKGKLFYEFFDGTSYMELCRKYDLGYEKAEPSAGAEPSPEGDGSTTNNFINVFRIAVGIQINEIPPSISPVQWEKIVEILHSMDRRLAEQQKIMETIFDSTTRTEYKVDGQGEELSDLRRDVIDAASISSERLNAIAQKLEKPIHLDEQACVSIRRLIGALEAVKSGKVNQDSGSNAIMRAIEDLRKKVDGLAPEQIEWILDRSSASTAYGVLARLVKITYDGSHDDLIKTMKNKELPEPDLDLNDNDTVFIIKYKKRKEALGLIFGKTSPDEIDEFSSYSRVRSFLKCYDSEGNVTDLNRDSFNTEKSNSLKRPKN